MAAGETLRQYFPHGGLKELGFKSPKPGGYAFEGTRLYTFYSGEVTRMTNEGPSTRRVLVLTDGESWLVGARDGIVKTSDMLDDLLHAVKESKANEHIFQGDVLPGILSVPDRLPEIARRSEEPSRTPRLNGISGHSFE